MCGRFYIDETNQRLHAYAEAARKSGFDVGKGEIFPGSVVPMLKYGEQTEISAAMWGYPVYDGKPIINIRTETVAEKPFCRESFFTRRCVIPCSGYYEWDKNKDKYLFSEGEITYLGGIFLNDGFINRFAVLTAAAVGAAFQIHERMPIVLKESDVDFWLCDSNFALTYIALAYRDNSFLLSVDAK